MENLLMCIISFHVPHRPSSSPLPPLDRHLSPQVQETPGCWATKEGGRMQDGEVTFVTSSSVAKAAITFDRSMRSSSLIWVSAGEHKLKSELLREAKMYLGGIYLKDGSINSSLKPCVKYPDT